MEKNAISILQEHLQKNNLGSPSYTLVKQEGPQHNISFTVRVTHKSYQADGTANTKKSAKLNAAIAMIELLNKHNFCIAFNEISSVDSPKTNPVVQHELILDKYNISQHKDTPSSIAPAINSIGTLQETCMKYNMKLPIYEEDEINAENQFTVRCKLGNLIETAHAPSKKKAKQISAELMLNHLVKLKLINNDCMVTGSQPNVDQAKIKTLEIEELRDYINIDYTSITQKVKKLFPEMKKNTGVTLVDQKNLSISNFHSIFRNSFESTKIDKFKAYFNSIKFNEIEHSIDDLQRILKTITGILEIQMTQTNLKTRCENKYAVKYEFYTVPVFLEIGIGNSFIEAHITVLIRTIRAIYLFLV